jgi:hypothetical protein
VSIAVPRSTLTVAMTVVVGVLVKTALIVCVTVVGSPGVVVGFELPSTLTTEIWALRASSGLLSGKASDEAMSEAMLKTESADNRDIMRFGKFS